jgi:hypothetical protein
MRSRPLQRIPDKTCRSYGRSCQHIQGTRIGDATHHLDVVGRAQLGWPRSFQALALPHSRFVCERMHTLLCTFGSSDTMVPCIQQHNYHDQRRIIKFLASQEGEGEFRQKAGRGQGQMSSPSEHQQSLLHTLRVRSTLLKWSQDNFEGLPGESAIGSLIKLLSSVGQTMESA